MSESKKETYYYDAQDNPVGPEEAVWAEVITRSPDGSVLEVEYYTVQGEGEKAVDVNSPSEA